MELTQAANKAEGNGQCVAETNHFMHDDDIRNELQLHGQTHPFPTAQGP